ncbi:antirestriction protein ArdC [Sphingomonas zeicaulis]|uniref:ArdC family protein n=1 Tax=Sphingomonas zeicaulis TaxID=1632740 RepID=UPI003D263913
MKTTDLYQTITDTIVAAIEAGTKPWACDWTRSGVQSMDPRRHNGERYRGINVLLLTMSAQINGYAGGTWMTYRQAQDLGGQVRRGEKATPIVYFKMLERERTNTRTGETEDYLIPMLKSYSVFNVDQIDGLPERFYPAPVALITGKERDTVAEAAIRSSGASIREDGGDRAFYRPSTDSIHLPAFDRFHTVGGYLATMAHEVIHWTGAKTRLDRRGGETFGDKAYAFEELVAEIGAAFICGRLGIAGEHLDNHAAYLGSWVKILRGDKRAIFKAASLAQAAADLALAGADEIAAEAAAHEAPLRMVLAA